MRISVSMHYLLDISFVHGLSSEEARNNAIRKIHTVWRSLIGWNDKEIRLRFMTSFSYYDGASFEKCEKRTFSINLIVFQANLLMMLNSYNVG